VAGRLAFVTDRLGIVELRQVCIDMRARNLQLFEQLGSWVATTADGALQRLFAEACHRHAWHAELWQLRMPTIPVAPRTPQPRMAPEIPGDARRRDDYRRALSGLRDELHSLGLRVDATLDPSSRRTIDLLAGDLDDLAGRLNAAATA
jgi:hypothetical protein